MRESEVVLLNNLVEQRVLGTVSFVTLGTESADRVGPSITRLLEQYGRGGVSLYLLFPAQTNSEPMILPQILTPDTFKNAIESI